MRAEHWLLMGHAKKSRKILLFGKPLLRDVNVCWKLEKKSTREDYIPFKTKVKRWLCPQKINPGNKKFI